MSEVDSNSIGIEQLAVIEEKIADIYASYAQATPELDVFWKAISVEELHHASWVRALSELYQAGKVSIVDDRFPLETLHTFQTYIDELLVDAKKGKLTPLMTLGVALDLEGTLAESSFHQTFATDATEVGELLNRLRRATEGHVERIENLWQQYKKSSHTKS